MIHNILIVISTFASLTMFIFMFVLKHGVSSKGNVLQRIKS